MPFLTESEPTHGAFYLFPDVSALFGKSNGDRTIATAEDFAMYLLEEAHVARLAGVCWNARVHPPSYAASEAH